MKAQARDPTVLADSGNASPVTSAGRTDIGVVDQARKVHTTQAEMGSGPRAPSFQFSAGCAWRTDPSFTRGRLAINSRVQDGFSRHFDVWPRRKPHPRLERSTFHLRDSGVPTYRFAVRLSGRDGILSAVTRGALELVLRTPSRAANCRRRRNTVIPATWPRTAT